MPRQSKSKVDIYKLIEVHIEPADEIKLEPVAEPLIKKQRKPRAKKEVQIPSPIETPERDREPEPEPEPATRVRKPNKWIEFVKQYRIEHPELTYTAAMTQAKVAYVR